MNVEAMLELAAKCMQDSGHRSFVNYEVIGEDLGVMLELGSRKGAITAYWNPARDNAAALTLAVLQKIDIKQYDGHVVCWYDGGFSGTSSVMHNGDPLAATRNAILQAVALQAIGRYSQ